jgi:hypothetical protein
VLEISSQDARYRIFLTWSVPYVLPDYAGWRVSVRFIPVNNNNQFKSNSEVIQRQFKDNSESDSGARKYQACPNRWRVIFQDQVKCS